MEGKWIRLLLERAFVRCLSDFFNASSWAVGSAGFTNQVTGVKALGMGNSFVALADDPSAVFFNAAGLTQLTSPSAYFAVYPHANLNKIFSRQRTTDSMKPVTPVVPNLYLTMPISNGRWALGLGINFPYGLETHWDKSSPLRFEATDSELVHANYSSVVAFKVNERVSVGGGLTYARTSASLASQLNVNCPEFRYWLPFG
jgi:long-chain fatty acid transport protein